MSGEMPEGWRSGRIADLVAEVTVRIDPQAVADPDTPYIGLEDIGQGTGTIISVGRASEATSQKSGFLSGDILFGKLRPNLKKVARPDFDGICSTDIAVFRAKAKVDPDFAFRALSSGPVIDHAVAQAAGTKMPRAHARSVLNFETILPPLDEQRRIAEVLRSVDEVVSLAEQSAHSARATFNRIIDDLHCRYEDRSAPLANFCVPKGLQTGPFGSQLKVSDYVDDGIPVIMPSDLRADGIDFSGAKSTSPQKANQLPQHHLKPGDVLFSRRGDVEKCGLYFEGDPPALCGTGCLRARIDVSKADPVLIYFLAQSDRCGSWLTQHAVGVTMPNLNTSIVGALPIPNLPLLEQRQWVDALLLAEGACRVNENYVGKAQKLKGVLSSDLLSGRVRVPA